MNMYYVSINTKIKHIYFHSHAHYIESYLKISHIGILGKI